MFYVLFMRDTERGREREGGRDRRSRLHARSPICDSILELWDHTLSQRQTFNPLSISDSVSAEIMVGRESSPQKDNTKAKR